MAKNDKIREKLYVKYSTNLELLKKRMGWKIGYMNEQGEFEEPASSFICPICSKIFIKESLNQNHSNPLTLEDVPPKKLGGKPITLTCKTCNNEIGGNKLDSKLKWNLQIEPFLKNEPNSQINAYYEINERTKAKGRLTYIKKNNYGISFNVGTNPNLKKELDYLIKNWDKSKIRFTFQAPKREMVLLGLLRIGYLKMFSTFGYGYLFNSSSQIIRQQLLEPNKEIITGFGIPQIDSLTVDRTGIHFITAPKELRSFLVIFQLELDGKSKIYSVIIPGPEEDCVKLYSEIKIEKNFNLELFPIPSSDYLTNPNNIFAFTEIWREF